MIAAYYNEFDPGAAAWLRELIRDGLIAPGDVDERSICDVQPADLHGYDQVHLFAGIGGWSHALRLAGWADDRPVWTGSCPCQPFSSAGKRRGQADRRHLWPEMFRLIRECRPATVFGEQVAAAIGHGWLDGVFADMEGAGYACGAAVLGAHSVAAPHKRQRCYWVADAEHLRRGAGDEQGSSAEIRRDRPAISGDAGGLGQPGGQGLEGHAGHVADGDQPGRVVAVADGPVAETGHSIGVGDATSDGRHARRAEPGRPVCAAGAGGWWSDYTIIRCADGKSRRIKPGLAPLVDGLPRGVVCGGDPGAPITLPTAEARRMRISGYGNAIVPQLAAEFIRAVMED